jgi:hypothetical protein
MGIKPPVVEPTIMPIQTRVFLLTSRPMPSVRRVGREASPGPPRHIEGRAIYLSQPFSL